MGFKSGKVPIRKPSKNVLMFVLSLGIGGVGVYYSKQYIETEIAQYKRSLETDDAMVEVVVPARSLVRGEIVAQSDLTLREIPEKYTDPNVITGSTYDTAVGQRVEFDVESGKPILWAHLEGGQSPTFSGKVPTGLRAMTIRVDEINSISGFLQPKDRIDLLLTFGGSDSKQIIPLIQNLNVIATGVQTYVDKQNSAKRSFSTITIQVSPEQAKKITLSQQIGKVTAMLRNPDDESPMSSLPMTVAQVLNLPKPTVKQVVKTRPKPKPIVKVNKPQIEYIIGGT